MFKTNILAFVVLSGLIVFFTSCTLHIPPDWDWDYEPLQVILKISPDDAQVMLNGKWIGDAYEFSTRESALKLATRNNELIIKRDGFVEEQIDLYRFTSNYITIRMNLKKDRDYRGNIQTERPPRPKRPAIEKTLPRDAEKPKTSTGYSPKTEPEKTLPDDIDNDSHNTKSNPIDVTIFNIPNESSIYLDGKFWGISPDSGKIENLRLLPGSYTLEILKPGFKPYKKIIQVKDKPFTLSIQLEK